MNGLTIQILCFALVALIANSTTHADSPWLADKPNILILLGDDIDRDDLGPWGGRAHTPNLDQLAKQGVCFDNAYANVAMCAPFRQELYSGRCAWRTRAMPNHSRSITGTKSLPHYLRPIGYRVGLLGKSHIGPRGAYPFDRIGDLPKKEDANPRALELATNYMLKAQNADQPFCMVVASHDGHGPYTNGDPSRYAGKIAMGAAELETELYKNSLAKHLAEVTHLDELLGSLMKVLDEHNLRENTLVIFCSEQGNAFPFSKWTCFDDGLATGVVASLPDTIPCGKRCDQMFWISDIVPTLIEAASGSYQDADFDGKSQWANFIGGNNQVHRYAYGAFSNCNILDNKQRIFPIRSIRDSRYSLIWSPRHDQEISSNVSLTQALALIQNESFEGKGNFATSWVQLAKQTETTDDDQLIHRLHHRPHWALYDRKSDPEELQNLIDNQDLAEKSGELKRELKSWLKEWGDSDPVATEKSFLKTR